MFHKMITFTTFKDFCEYCDIVQIIDSDLFKQAMTHPGVSREKNYERLEFLGDSVLNSTVTKILFDRFQYDKEGELAKKKSFLVSRDICAKIAKDIKLPIVCQVGDIDSIKACALEAFIAVIYLEHGEQKLRYIVDFLFFPYLEHYTGSIKSILQEICQKKFNCLPCYTILKKEGSEHFPVFTVMLEVGGYQTFGFGSNKKLAEKNAAARMMEVLES
jgi:ribonuclease-3